MPPVITQSRQEFLASLVTLPDENRQTSVLRSRLAGQAYTHVLSRNIGTSADRNTFICHYNSSKSACVRPEDIKILHKWFSECIVAGTGEGWYLTTAPEAITGNYFGKCLFIDGSKVNYISILPRYEKLLRQYASEETLQKVVEWRVEKQVCDVLEVTQKIYRKFLSAVRVVISTDPEIPDRERVRMILNVLGNPEEVLKCELQFKEWMYNSLDQRAYELIVITYNWDAKE